MWDKTKEIYILHGLQRLLMGKVSSNVCLLFFHAGRQGQGWAGKNCMSDPSAKQGEVVHSKSADVCNCCIPLAKSIGVDLLQAERLRGEQWLAMTLKVLLVPATSRSTFQPATSPSSLNCWLISFFFTAKFDRIGRLGRGLLGRGHIRQPKSTRQAVWGEAFWGRGT